MGAAGRKFIRALKPAAMAALLAAGLCFGPANAAAPAANAGSAAASAGHNSAPSPAGAGGKKPAAPAPQPAAPAPRRAELTAEARLTKNGPIIRNGMQWRVYSASLGIDNRPKIVAQSQNGQPKFSLKPGDYIIFAAFGRASQTRSISLGEGEITSASFDLEAGGLKLSAALPDGKINEKQLHFTIYAGDNDNEQKPLIDNIKSGDIIRLPAGAYHIVCEYGSANAITRSNIHIEAGKLTEAVMQQRAAQIILKLVRQKGGEALADTNWAIMNDGGDIVREIANANAYIILQEGDYVAVARNKDQIYQKEFSVVPGKDEEIEVPATAQNSVDEDGID